MDHAVAQRHKTVARDPVTNERKREFAFAPSKFAFPKNRGCADGDTINGGKGPRWCRPQQDF